jgi:hypothetical protein
VSKVSCPKSKYTSDIELIINNNTIIPCCRVKAVGGCLSVCESNKNAVITGINSHSKKTPKP